MEWLLFIISLPGKSGTARMRIWRALKTAGAAVLRDGVYVLPNTHNHNELFMALAADVKELGGGAHIVPHVSGDATPGEDFTGLFDRTEEYSLWRQRADTVAAALTGNTEARARRELAQLRHELDQLSAIDFFPAVEHHQALAFMQRLERDTDALFSPDEPTAGEGELQKLKPESYQGRVWATRRNMWVDRVASAWLIERCIDRKAKFLWLASPADCPADAIGFDFDGATFSHVGSLVTFEVLLHSFGLTVDAALSRIATLVHYLDVGGAPVSEASGIATLLAGARERAGNDDKFLQHAGELFDDLYHAYRSGSVA